jgi:type IX secretion system substrate protein
MKASNAIGIFISMKSITVMLLVVWSTTIVNSQVPYFLTEGTRWVYSSRESSEPGQQTVNSSEKQYIIHGDTVIGGVSYAKLYTTTHHVLEVFHSWPPHSEYIHSYDSIGPSFIRHDTVLKKMYYLPSIDSTEKLIYDFDLEIGDVTPLQSINFDTTMVIAIDTIVVLGVPVKRFFISDDRQDIPDDINYILEGIGGSNGLLSSFPEVYPLGGGVYTTLLNCFEFQDSTYLVFDYECPFLDFISAIDQISDEPSVIIYPNPTRDFITVNISDEYLNATCTIFDGTGRVIQSIKLAEVHTLIQLDTIGLYFWQLNYKGNFVQAGKIISQ